MPDPDQPPADDGAAHQKVLLGGVLLLFALTLVGLGAVLTSARKPPIAEQPYVPGPAGPSDKK